MSHYKPRMSIVLDVPRTGAPPAEDDGIQLRPALIDAHWTKNSYLEADVLEVTLPWRESGIDPRELRNARCQFYLWDANHEEFDERKHLRFAGIAKSAKRVMSEAASHVVIKLHDYTDLFIGMHPFPTDGVPDFTDDITSAWAKICDHTGYCDDDGKIHSSVKALRDNILIDPRVPQGPIGRAVASRFHAIAKPQPPTNCSAWAAWQHIVGMLGLVSYIDKDQCIVTTDAALYDSSNAPRFLQGENIISLEEEADTAVCNKAVMLKSFDPLRGVQLESIWPPPGDPRVKVSRAAAKRATKTGAGLSANDVSRELDTFFRYDITDQATLDAAAREAYAVRARQELTGTLRTAEMRVTGEDHAEVDVLSMATGDSITVGVDLAITEVASISGGEADRVAYLVDRLGYDLGLAELIARQITAGLIESPRYHVKSLDVHLGSETFEIGVAYQSVLTTEH